NGGQEVAYAITENAVEGYTATYEGYNVTNSYTPEETGFSVSKVWADSDDADGIRPDEVEIKLFANGEDTGIVLVLSEETKWVGSINGLPKYWEGKEIVYTVEEVAVKGYNTVIKGTVEEGFTVTNSHVVIPDTGDNRNPVMWISLMAGAVLTAGVALFTKKRKTAK
ncbi:MAG: Cna B-type domain-containing protein, partial [Clostridia bacterium]|nr:Cna B-type domain-containing protein [Clostridia bacterium]